MNLSAGHAITIDEITPAWLTETLRRQHLLAKGEVVTIEKQPTSAFNSHTLHLRVVYGQGVDAASLPSRFLLKCSLPVAWAQRAGAREVAFYRMVATLPDHPAVIAPCYDAVFEAETGKSHILLQDLSDSHVVGVERENQITLVNNLPSAIHLEQAVDALARFHAYWWQHAQLGSGIAPIAWGCKDEETFVAEIARRRRALDHLLTQEGDWLPPHVQAIYANIIERMMPVWQTYMQTRVDTFANLTLTHGDAYLANFLCPKEGVAGNAYIIDWQSPEAYRGTTDLANMCATFWTREQRAAGERELNVLRQYHRTLQAHGVTDYSWEELVRDYRLSIADWLLIPLQDFFDGSRKSYWWPKMQCLADAYEDWHVAELLGSGRQ